jgi:hypothetical protein
LTDALFFIISSVMLVIILDSNFLMGFLQEKLLPFNNKIIIFSTYVSIFVISNLLLLIMTYSIGYLKEIEEDEQSHEEIKKLLKKWE